MLHTCVIFDIDGTLVDSSGFEDQLFEAAVRDVLGNVALRASWGEYPHFTDAGILREICRENGLDHTHYEDRFRARFGELVAEHLRQSGACPPVAGAIALFETLRSQRGCAVGIATGGWGHTARMKLREAGFTMDGVPLACSDDHHERTGIMTRCREQLPAAEHCIYIGDGVWDKAASEQLGWRFIGVGARLQGRCDHWVPDLSAPDVLAVLQV
jgi:beta-phosphoglucomutase-like phosphatase (HAD superfamily)